MGKNSDYYTLSSTGYQAKRASSSYPLLLPPHGIGGCYQYSIKYVYTINGVNMCQSLMDPSKVFACPTREYCEQLSATGGLSSV